MSIATPLTPLESRPDLAAALGLDAVLVKRDDLLPFYGGGSKTRKIAGLLRDPAASAASHWIVSGGSHSNQIRIVAAAAAQAGKQCVAVAFDAPASGTTPNLRLAAWAGAKLEIRPAADPFAQQRELRAIARRLADAGATTYLVPAATADDVREYTKAGAEFRGQHGSAATIFIAAGTGATAAGLAAGLGAGAPIEVIAVSVHLAAPDLELACKRHWRNAGVAPAVDVTMRYLDGLVAPGYGFPSNASIECTEWAAAHGLLVDPLYSGRALAGLVAAARAGTLQRGVLPVFWHSGGTTVTAGIDRSFSTHDQE